MIKKKYKNPAVQEAIFEAKFEQYNFDSAAIGQIFNLIKNTYPDKKDIKHVPILLDKSGNISPTTIQIEAPQFRAVKSDNSELLQFGPGIVTANKLKYISWDDFTIAINTALKSYISVTEPKFSTRIATRYINSFHIPESVINVRDYFNIGLQIPAEISDIQAFNMTLINKFNNDNLEFQIYTRFFSDTLKEEETGNRFILDIDCFSISKFSPNIEKLISIAAEAHKYLKMVFESIITDRTRALMETTNE